MRFYFSLVTFTGYVFSIGGTVYVARIGPSLLSEARTFCSAENKVLYTPSFESVHTAIYEKLKAYSITTFWTNAKYNKVAGKMEWM